MLMVKVFIILETIKNLNNMYEIKTKPWVYKGVKNVDDCKTAAECMAVAGLDWTVAKTAVLAEMPSHGESFDDETSFFYGNHQYRAVPNTYTTYRTDTNQPLGIVKSKYTPVQNIDAFKFFDGAIGKDKAIWQTAGVFNGGARVFVSAKLPDNIIVDGIDPIENYLVFTTSHDGTSGVKILFTPIRVVCQNTLNAAIRNAKNFISLRHTENVFKKLSVADQILGISKENTKFLSEAYNFMATEKVNDQFARQVFGDVILTQAEKERLKDTGHTVSQIINRDNTAMYDAQISMRKVNAISEMYQYYQYGIGQKDIAGTKWGVYNAVTGFYSNVDNAKDEKRMDSILYGDKSKKIELAGNLIIG